MNDVRTFFAQMNPFPPEIMAEAMVIGAKVHGPVSCGPTELTLNETLYRMGQLEMLTNDRPDLAIRPGAATD